MTQDMAEEGNRSETQSSRGSGPMADESTQIKKRARRRLIGAAALALFAAIILPMVMDHQPAPPMRDIQVRIPSPDEGVTQRVATKPIAKEEPSKALAKAELKQEPRPEKSEPKADPKPDVTAAAKTEPKVEASSDAKKADEKPGAEAPAKESKEVWEVQLGAYQEAGRVKLLTGKLKELRVPAYTEVVETPNGQRTRVRAGPFPSQEAAEKAKARIKIIGVDGPVARKP
jgi:DedD protein